MRVLGFNAGIFYPEKLFVVLTLSLSFSTFCLKNRTMYDLAREVLTDSLCSPRVEDFLGDYLFHLSFLIY